MSKGSNPRPFSVSQDEFGNNFDKIFKKAGVKSGRYKIDPETHKAIPLVDYYNKYGWPKPKPRTAYIRGDIEPYMSPVTGKMITSRKAHREDLERTGSRVYEGREQEQKEADRFRAEEEKKFDKFMDEALSETYYQLRDGLIKPETEIKSQWLIGED